MDSQIVQEEWKPVVGFESCYSVSNLGRIRRDAPRCPGQAGGILNPTRPDRYFRISLERKPKRVRKYLHVIVAEAFIGPQPVGWQVHHIDGNKLNNRVDNLEYVTHQDNVKHAREVLGVLDNRGERDGAHKLTAETVRELRRLISSGHTRCDVASRFFITPHYVRQVFRRERWKHVA